MVGLMSKLIAQTLLILVCCFPSFTMAATTTHTIQAAWSAYTAPSGYTLLGFNLYQDGVQACQTSSPSATSLDCTVSLSTDTANFTLAASFSDGTESPKSEPFTFTRPTQTPGISPSSTTTIHAAWTAYTAPSGYTVSRFNLYQEGVQVCQTTSATATSLDCPVTLSADSASFTLTAAFSDGSESPHSTPFVLNTAATTSPLAAVFTTNLTTGTAPVTVNFNASASTGSIAAYQWDFGDGTTATGSTVNHIYASAGSYLAKLTVANAANQTNSTSSTITVKAPAVQVTTPPTAVIASSTAAGQAPLTVTFSGAGSSAATGATISTYSWNFGDSSSATGASAAHAFTTAGTYTTTLTVTDSKGLTSSTTTPIVVTAPTVANKIPTAKITATPTTGAAPLTVKFDATGSADSDGSIVSYIWTFGDGSTASGSSASHTYTTAANYTATLKVVDNLGASSSTTTAIAAQSAVPAASSIKMESGEVDIDHNWVYVPFATKFVNPIVIAGPPSFNGAQACAVRIRNVTTTGFEIRVAEWDYLDGIHMVENVSYMVLEKGRTTLPDGSAIEAGSLSGATSSKSINFSKAFTKKPVVLTTIVSNNEAEVISGRIKDISLTGFAYYFREQEKNSNVHAAETVHYVAWEPGKGVAGKLRYEVAVLPATVNQVWYAAKLQSTHAQQPFLLSDMQTANGTDSSALRVQQTTASGFQVQVQEEQSYDAETEHAMETIGYFALSSSE